jgi:signal transduction histidine kinase
MSIKPTQPTPSAPSPLTPSDAHGAPGGRATVDGPREVVSAASRRLRALAALSGSLTDAMDPADAADLVEQQALSALGATSAVVVTLGPFPSSAPPAWKAHAPAASATLHVVHAIGVPAEVRAALEALPLDAPVPFAEVARGGHALFLPDEHALLCYPDWGARMVASGARSVAVVPVWANGQLRGVLGLAWAAPREFDEDERAFVSTLGVMAAQAIMRAHLRAAELQARSAAEHANATKAAFLATVSHELRTPMNAVLGYTALVVEEIDGPVTPQQREHLGRVAASGKHLLALIDDLLGYARMEAGEEVVRPADVTVCDIVEQSLLLVRPMAKAKALDLHVDCPNPDLVLHTDRRRLSQVLVNLLANAIKFTAAGGVHLVVRATGERVEMQVRFEVSDTGRGIAPDDQERVFEPFWRQEPAAAQRDGSTGLGLSVARQLTRLLGGDLMLARSAVGVGSTFVVTLPIRYVDSPHPIDLAPARAPDPPAADA